MRDTLRLLTPTDDCVFTRTKRRKRSSSTSGTPEAGTASYRSKFIWEIQTRNSFPCRQETVFLVWLFLRRLSCYAGKLRRPACQHNLAHGTLFPLQVVDSQKSSSSPSCMVSTVRTDLQNCGMLKGPTLQMKSDFFFSIVGKIKKKKYSI